MAELVRRRWVPKEGDLVRVLFVHMFEKDREFFEGKVAVVQSVYGFRCYVRRVCGPITGVGREVRWEHMKPVTDDELTEKEWSQVAAWRLTHG